MAIDAAQEVRNADFYISNCFMKQRMAAVVDGLRQKKNVSKPIKQTETHCPEKWAADSWISLLKKVSCDAISSEAFGA